MKLSSSLLFFAFPVASAFYVQGPKSSSTALASSVQQQGINGVYQGSAPYAGGPVSNREVLSSDIDKMIWEVTKPITVQGSSLKTWSFKTSYVDRVQVALKTSGRPLNADVDLWQGPDNAPQKMAIYIEDGDLRPFNCVIETPGGDNAIAIRNTGQMEFPLSAAVRGEVEGSAGLGIAMKSLAELRSSKTIQGGAVHTYPFDPSVSSVQILLKTDGRPLNARIELLQGPNNNKQVIELYTEDGLERPFFAIIETPGSGNVVRLINTATVEFPLTATVEPYKIEKFTERRMDGDFFMVN